MLVAYCFISLISNVYLSILVCKGRKYFVILQQKRVSKHPFYMYKFEKLRLCLKPIRFRLKRPIHYLMA